MLDSINKCCAVVGDAGNSHISVERAGEAASIAVSKGRDDNGIAATMVLICSYFAIEQILIVMPRHAKIH